MKVWSKKKKVLKESEPWNLLEDQSLWWNIACGWKFLILEGAEYF